MNIALFGHGAMGQLVARLAADAGHRAEFVPSSQEANRTSESLLGFLREFDVAIDFTVADAVPSNVALCIKAGLPLVEGTTGWGTKSGEVKEVVLSGDGAVVVGANFSIGVNVFYKIAACAGELFSGFDGYDVFIREEHHKRKRDAPSGTAIALKNVIQEFYVSDVPVTSTRAGYIPGTHELGFDSAADQIVLKHTARSREGFAAGALLAADWIKDRSGYFEFSQVIEDMLRRKVREL